MKPLSIAGQRFGRLVAISRDGTDKHGKATWRFQCDCGATCVNTASQVKDGSINSCGCLRAETAKANALLGGKKDRHGATHSASEIHSEYGIWKSMRQRCSNANSVDYPAYGGRGIKVCARWDSFESFIEDMGKRPSEQHSIDRIDTNGNYEPSNCRWADDITQAANRRTRGTAEYANKGETQNGN